jgi:hypothetical protein
MNNFSNNPWLWNYMKHALLGFALLLAVPLADNPSWTGLAYAQEGEE